MDEIDDIQVEVNERLSFDKDQNIGSDIEEDREDEDKREDDNLLDKTSKWLHECK